MSSVRRAVVAVVVALAAAALSAPASAARDYGIIARDVVPSGAQGAVPVPSDAGREASMYDALTPLFNRVTAADVARLFKPETLGIATPGPTSTERPRAGLAIRFDGYHVAHIHGANRDALTWGSGWVMAEQRGLLLQQARYDSLVAAIDAPGLSALNLVSSLKSFTPSAQTEAEVAKQTGVLLAHGAKGRAILHDIDVYLQGINAYFAAHGGNPHPFTRTDAYALNALKDQFVGEGGGDEPRRAQFLSALRAHLGARRGTGVWNDLREANDPETPVSVPGTVRFQPPPSSTSGNVVIDAGSLDTATANASAAPRHYASNALLVSGARSATHHPIMVAGPQIGYFYPGLTLEVDESAPGITQRGVTAALFPGYIFIGRSQDSGWSLTSAGLDQIDTYAETLCGGSTRMYLFRGRCRPMQRFDAGKLGGQEIVFFRTVHGPVTGYARIHGRLVALARKRASYGQDVLDQLFYHDLSHGLVHNFHQFAAAASQTPQTFNSLYVDDRHIGVFTSGLIPIRPRNVDPGLPIDGRGGEEWRGWVPARDHPQGEDPASGEIVNWNNRTQAGYEAADDNWALGAVHRVMLLMRNLGNGRNITPQHIVGAMNAAGTQDVREVTFEPVLSKLLHGGRAPSPLAARELAVLDAWYHHGASRLDRTDPSGTGNITDPGAAVMDTAWPLLTSAWASSVLGPQLSLELASIVARFQAPPGGQNAGWHVYMDKDLRTLLGERVRGRFSVRYCGAGSLSRCRAILWGALQQAGQTLAAQQGSNPSTWRVSAAPERIKFVPGLLPTTMRYTNRPTGIQQVLSFGGHSPFDTGR